MEFGVAEKYLLPAIAVLATVITYLFKIVFQRLKDCEEDRAKLWRYILQTGDDLDARTTNDPQRD